MSDVPAGLRRLVLRRAQGRCEYCHLSQIGQEATFHVDHVLPVAAGGATGEHNLALACVSCSLRKGARQQAIDPDTGEEASIFNPRLAAWTEHFKWEGVRLIGLTSTARATINLMELNRSVILAIRQEEAALGRHP